jgi:agmatinase
MAGPAFLGLGAPHTDAQDARYWVVPVPYERTTSYQQGTRGGPDAILRASTQVEFHDEELGVQPARAGIHTLAPVPGDEGPESFCRRLEHAYGTWCADHRVVGLLGGEHTVTVGPVRALAARHPRLGVLQIDAHADLRDAYEGSAYSHACVARRVAEVADVVQVGIRALSAPEAVFLRESPRVRAFFAHERHDDLPRRVAEALPDAVYVTLDIDGLDPSEAPGTGTPEPGGLRYREVLALLREVARRKRIVGFDVVEVRPLDGSTVTEFLAARLVYKLIGYTETRGGTVTPTWVHPALE